MCKRAYEFDVGEVLELLGQKLIDEGKLEEGDRYMELSVNRSGVITVSVEESKRK